MAAGSRLLRYSHVNFSKKTFFNIFKQAVETGVLQTFNTCAAKH